MKTIGWYYLALLTWIVEVIMFGSILLIPFVILLRENYAWWKTPFRAANWNSWIGG